MLFYGPIVINSHEGVDAAARTSFVEIPSGSKPNRGLSKKDRDDEIALGGGTVLFRYYVYNYFVLIKSPYILKGIIPTSMGFNITLGRCLYRLK